MKKVIAAAAGLMLAGAMVGSASAAVTFGGDARVRYLYETDYDFGIRSAVMVENEETGDLVPTGATIRTNELDEKVTSRVRVKVDVDTDSGVYARSRIRMTDATWDGTKQTRDKGAGTNSYVDYAYLGVPFGPVTVEGGLMTQNLTKFFLWDRRGDQAVLTFANDMTTVQAWFEKRAEYINPATDTIDDDDINIWYGALIQKFSADWSMAIIGAYIDDQRPADDISGFTGTFHVGGPAGPVALEAEVAYQEGDIAASDDDGYGGYLQAGVNFGAASVAVNTGWTQDGFAADNDFGFLMIGGASAITPEFFDSNETGVGNGGDTTWVGGIFGFKASEALSLTGILAFADIDEVGSAVEVSGSVGYTVVDGATLTWDIGYLALDLDKHDEENPFGTALTLEISY